jgi:hypothetical protein
MKTTINFTPVDMEARKALDFASGDVVRVWNKIKENEGNDSKDRKNDPDLFLKKNGKQAYLDLLKESKERSQELGTVNSYRYLQKNFPNLLPMLKGK